MSAARVLRDRLSELWQARELLRQFTAKELKIRYRNSALGFLWSLLTPALMTLLFTALFGVAFRLDVEDYPAFFVSGYLLWQFFQTSVMGSITAIVGNGALVKKVWFPREVLPLSIVVSQLIHFGLAMLVISPFLVATRGVGVLLHLPAALLAVALLLVFTAGLAMAFAGANVPFRDLQELIVVIFLVWFYATPVLYPSALVRSSGEGIVAVLGTVTAYNPLSWFVELFRTATYGTVTAQPDPVADDPTRLTFVTGPPGWAEWDLFVLAAVGALTMFVVGYVSFNRLARSFAKEV